MFTSSSFSSRALFAFFLAASTMGCEAIAGIDDRTLAPADPAKTQSSALSCTTNKECMAAADGQPAVCRARDKQCVRLLSEDCSKVIGADNLASDDVIVMGTLFSLTGSNASAGAARANAVELAVSEITSTAVGIPGGKAGRPRPIAVVSCDDANDKIRAATHLVDDVDVPAIIGAGASGNTIAVAQNVTIPKGRLLLSPSSTSMAISSLQDDGLVWRTAPSDALQAIALRDQLAQLEKQVKTEQSISTVRVAVVNKDDAYGIGLAGSISDGLQVNGALATAANNPNFKQIQYPATGDASAAVAALQKLAPHVIVLIGTSEAVTGIVKPLEAGSWWGARPYYLVADGLKKSELLDALADNEALRLRTRGTVPFSASNLANAFYARYSAVYPDQPLIFGMAGAYDATYLLAYAATAAQGKALTGRALADGLSQMVGGSTKIAAGPNALNTAFAALGSGSAIDFDGASGPLDFDTQTGEAPADISVFCVGRPDGKTASFVDSGRYYAAASGAMTGTYACK